MVEVVRADVRFLELGFVGEFHLRSLTVYRFNKTFLRVSVRYNGSLNWKNCSGYG